MRYSFIFLLSCFGCMDANTKTDDTNEATDNSSTNVDSNLNTWELAICETSYNDSFVLWELSAEGTTLEVTVGYSGGCSEHEWELCWDGSVAESWPLQVWFTLGHNANGDSCEAEESEVLTFDISSMGVGSDPTTIHLEGQSITINAENQ